MLDESGALLGVPLLPLLPLATGLLALREAAFARRHFLALLAPSEGALQPQAAR